MSGTSGAFKPRMRLRTKLALLVTALILVTMLPLSLALTARAARAKVEEMARRATAIAKLMAQIEVTSVVQGRRLPPQVIQSYISLSRSIDPSIAYVVVTDPLGQVIAGEVNGEMIGAAGRTDREMLEQVAPEGAGMGPDLKAVSIEVEEAGRKLGRVKLGFSLRGMRSEIRRGVLTNGFLTLAVVLLGMVATHVFAARISRPVETLAGAMRQVRGGNFDARVAVASRDEIGMLADSFNVMAQGLKEREWIKSTFARYVSRQVAEKILAEKKPADFEGELRRVTILFADIRGFTSLAETLRPREVIALLNEYFDAMIRVIFKHEGTLDKFIGDQVMALYGAPLDQDGAEIRAVRTAVEIQEVLAALNERRARRNQPVVQIGIGINTAEVVAGNVGSEERTEYTVVGDGVNVAQRIESAAVKGQILISESTYQAVEDEVEATPLPDVQVKGRSEPVRLYSVARMRS